MIDHDVFEMDCLDWLHNQIESLTETISFPKPSEWAETNRYLPKQVTPFPGYYSYDVTPALREIIDCMDITSSVRECYFMKGAQIGATVGVGENLVGYAIDVLRSVPMMWLTSDTDAAKLRMDTYIMPMIDQSGLRHKIQSGEDGSRKTGRTEKKIEWSGGGYLIPAGAKSPNKGRSVSIQYLIGDEIDSYPISTGKQGDTLSIFEARLKAYYHMRKIFYASTPLYKATSRILKKFLQGDQRYYFVPCKSCGEYQILRFSGECSETKRKWGLVWQLNSDGLLDYATVRYVCRHCFHPHTNSDKIQMFARGEWRPTAKPVSPDIRSYHLSALYSPAAMYPWGALVGQYLKAWDFEKNEVRDVAELQTFYNNDLGEAFREYGQRIKFEAISGHRRTDYAYGQIPNSFAVRFMDSHVYFLTCSVDVHKDNLAVGVFGWTKGGRVLLIDYWRFYGDCEDIEDQDTWGKLQDLIDNKRYVADDGKTYWIAATSVDSQFLTSVVYQFCAIWQSGVYPAQGRDMPTKGARMREFAPFNTQLGTLAYGITVNLYKDRWASSLRRSWDGLSLQPQSYFNAPVDATDKQLKELGAETKKEVKDELTQKSLKVVWHRPSGVDNELWDILIYSSFLFDLCMFDVCINRLELEQADALTFFNYVDQHPGLYFSEA